jgi:mannose-6-phosphate isomerase-like protein (cupin superfamily)
MSGFTVKAIDEMGVIHNGLVKLAGAELGVKSFGMQVLDFPANFEHYPEHDHAADGMEEVYVVLRGSGEFEVDGERVAVDPGRIIRIESSTRRKLLPGPDGVRVLALGCTVGKPYARPEDFQVAAQS